MLNHISSHDMEISQVNWSCFYSYLCVNALAFKVKPEVKEVLDVPVLRADVNLS